MGSTSGVLNVWRREWYRIGHSWRSLALTLLLPTAGMLFFWLLLHDVALQNLPTALCDQDQSPLSHQLSRLIAATPEIRLTHTVASPDQGEELIGSGAVRALVWIPKGFQRQLSSGEQATIVSWISGTNLSADGAIDRSLQQTIKTFSTGVALKRLCLQGLADQDALATAMPIRFIDHTLFNPTLDYGWYLLPCFLGMMLLLAVLLSAIHAIGSELREGTSSEWYASARGSLFCALAGKLTPYLLLHMLLAQVLFGLLFWGVELPLKGSLLLLEAGTLLLILSYQAIALAIVAATGNLRLSLSLGGGYGVAAFSFSGLTFPTQAMYPFIRLLSHLFPFRAFTELLIGQTLWGTTPTDTWRPLLGMGLFLLLPVPLMTRLRNLIVNNRIFGSL